MILTSPPVPAVDPSLDACLLTSTSSMFQRESCIWLLQGAHDTLLSSDDLCRQSGAALDAVTISCHILLAAEFPLCCLSYSGSV